MEIHFSLYCFITHINNTFLQETGMKTSACCLGQCINYTMYYQYLCTRAAGAILGITFYCYKFIHKI